MNEQKKELLVLGILAAIVLGLALWYMATHPAPTAYAPAGQQAPGAQEDERIADAGQYYEIQAAFPKTVPLPLSSRSDASVQAAALMKAWVQDEAASFKADSGLVTLTPEQAQMMGFDDGRKYTLDIEYMPYASPKTISYLYRIFADTGGAHPNTYFHSFSFDASTGNNLIISSIFAPGSDYLGRLSSVARDELPAIIAEREQMAVSEVSMDMLLDGTEPQIESFQTFYIDGGDLVIVFPPYQVGPYVLGTVLLPIPLADLADILKPEYQP